MQDSIVSSCWLTYFLIYFPQLFQPKEALFPKRSANSFKFTADTPCLRNFFCSLCRFGKIVLVYTNQKSFPELTLARTTTGFVAYFSKKYHIKPLTFSENMLQ